MCVSQNKRLAAILVVVLAACAPSVISEPDPATLLPSTAQPQQAATASAVPNTEPASLLDQAVADLAARLNVSQSEIEVIIQEEVIWNDGSLGCPQPGTGYILILIEGTRIVLQHNGMLYDYHGGPSEIFLCEQTKPTLQPVQRVTIAPVLTGTPIDLVGEEASLKPTIEVPPGFQPLVDKATADLAARLSVDSTDIEVVGAEAVEWRDSSLGCPQPGLMYLQVLSDGARIELRVQDKVYSYHSGRGGDPFLCENPSK